MENNPRENVVHLFLNNNDIKGESQVMEAQQRNQMGICDQCGQEKSLVNGRCDECFETYGDPLEDAGEAYPVMSHLDTGGQEKFQNECPSVTASNSSQVENAAGTTESAVGQSIVNNPIKEENECQPVLLSSGQWSLFSEDAFIDSSEIKTNEEKSPEKDEGCGKDENKKSSGAKDSNKTSTTKPSSTRSTVNKQDIEVEADWSVHYALHTFNVGDFFNPMPASGKVTLEELRQRMELDFFEMTHQRVKWDYDESKKRLYPDVSGTSKGAF